MSEAYRPFLLDEKRQPFTKREKRQWKLRYEPRMYDYELIPLEKLAGQPEPEEEKMSVLGFLALVFLSAILDVPAPEGSDIDEEGKIETPQSTMIAKS